MFDRVSVAAERLASNVSRRHFLGSLGRWAGATALAMAGVLSTAGSARAVRGHCYYWCPDGTMCSKGTCARNNGCRNFITCGQMTCGLAGCA
jgi:hypothetical protein